MSVLRPLADRPLVWTARNLARHIVPMFMAFLFLALSQPGRSAPTPAPPSFPVGKITATPVVNGGGHPLLTWTTTLPEGATSADYVFFIRQKQLHSGLHWDISIAGQGEQLSPLVIEPTGCTFELWAVTPASVMP